MSSSPLLPSADPCCLPCEEPTTVQVPGPQGDPGANGTNGTDGINAFSFANQFTMPAEGANVTITVLDSEWMAPLENVFVNGGGSVGTFQVQSMPTTTSVILKNIANTGLSQYTANSAPGTVFPNGSIIVHSGYQGPTGSTPSTSGFLQSANNLSDVADPATSCNNLGLGTAAFLDTGVAAGDLPAISAGAIAAGDFVIGTGAGVTGQDAAAARTTMGLGSAALVDIGVLDTQIAPNDGNLTPSELVIGTGVGIQTVDAATALSILGISGGTFPMVLFRHQNASGNGGTFTSGSPQTVPINTEVIDTDNLASISGNTMTLAAGTWRYRFGVMGYKCGKFQGWIQNTSDAVAIANSYSTSMNSDNGSTTTMLSIGVGRFTLSGTKNLELQAQCDVGQASSGFGLQSGLLLGQEVFSFIELWKE